jgi:hypothetical protein
VCPLILSIGLSINSSLLGTAGASAAEPEHAKCQVVLLLLGELRTTEQKVRGSSPFGRATKGNAFAGVSSVVSFLRCPVPA